MSGGMTANTLSSMSSRTLRRSSEGSVWIKLPTTVEVLPLPERPVSLHVTLPVAVLLCSWKKSSNNSSSERAMMCTSSFPTKRRARPRDCRGRELDSCKMSAAALGPNNLKNGVEEEQCSTKGSLHLIDQGYLGISARAGSCQAG
ncbi:hypothetical protein EYF80_006765 [Liparis tanakae]|uniref:Uncharacterized protein n=1 Tax=Liparis tanakae TaxID=230148 RepID=A0A4Z2IZ88_9TELE|nr:hypothetical protein EYF80_006765 [Liparis tanakae]